MEKGKTVNLADIQRREKRVSRSVDRKRGGSGKARTAKARKRKNRRAVAPGMGAPRIQKEMGGREKNNKRGRKESKGVLEGASGPRRQPVEKGKGWETSPREETCRSAS